MSEFPPAKRWTLRHRKTVTEWLLIAQAVSQAFSVCNEYDYNATQRESIQKQQATKKQGATKPPAMMIAETQRAELTTKNVRVPSSEKIKSSSPEDGHQRRLLVARTVSQSASKQQIDGMTQFASNAARRKMVRSQSSSTTVSLQSQHSIPTAAKPHKRNSDEPVECKSKDQRESEQQGNKNCKMRFCEREH